MTRNSDEDSRVRANKDGEAGSSRTNAGPSPVKSVRRSIGEWETGKPKTVVPGSTQLTPKKAEAEEPQRPKARAVPLKEGKAAPVPIPKRASVEPITPPKKEQPKYPNRVAEARACANRAKIHLGNSRNLKTEIKGEVLQAVDRLYQMIKESEMERLQGGKQERVEQPQPQVELVKQSVGTQTETERRDEERKRMGKDEGMLKNAEEALALRIDEHAKILKESMQRMEELKDTLERKTYASVAAATIRKQPPEQPALLSMVVSAKDDQETGEEVLNRIRSAVNAKEGGIVIDRIRKAKDRKVIIGCRSETERQKVRDRIRSAEGNLLVEDIKNKDPLVIIRDVLNYNTDEEVLSALRKQNTQLYKGLNEEENRMVIAYKKRTRNPHASHYVLRVSPGIWQRMMEAETVHVDLQRVRVADQSPLVQCSMCLGYGHGRRFCKEVTERCSHCGGPHVKDKCAEWLAGADPACCNCAQAKLEKIDHNAFSTECLVRKKWESLARATIAYC